MAAYLWVVIKEYGDNKMQLVETSTEIIFDPNPANGALNQGALTWTKGYIGSYGKWAKFYQAQITADNTLRINRILDKKGVPDTIETINLEINSNFEKTGDFSYCTRCTTNRAMNIFQQNSGGSEQLWTIIQFSHDTERKMRENNLVHPGDSSYIKTFSRYKQHLYFIVVNADLTETLHYVNLKAYNANEDIPTTLTKSIVVDKTDILAGEQYLYLATYDGVSDQQIELYNHGTLTVVDETWTNIFTSDSYDDYPVQMLEIDNYDLLVRKKGTQLYRIKGLVDPEVLLLSDTLDEDLSQFRINNRGFIYVEGSDFSQITGDYDEHIDKWYLINDSLTLETFLSGVVAEILTDCGIGVADIDMSEITDTSCRGFKIEGQTQIEVLRELYLLYDFSLPVIDGKVTAKKVTTDTTPTVISINKIGMGLNNPPDSVITITSEIADTDYPKQVTVRFTDADDNYKESAFILRSQDSDSSEIKDVDLSNHSLSDSIAQDAAHNTFIKWYTEKSFFSFTASLYYLEELQPGSLISITYNSEDYELKVISITVRDVLIDVTCVKNYV